MYVKSVIIKIYVEICSILGFAPNPFDMLPATKLM